MKAIRLCGRTGGFKAQDSSWFRDGCVAVIGWQALICKMQLCKHTPALLRASEQEWGQHGATIRTG